MFHQTNLGIAKSNQWVKKPIKFLIVGLGSNNGKVRQRARDALVSKNHQAVASLIAALKSENAHRRWEAAKALVELRDPSTVPTLVELLDNEDIDLRWLAAEGLVALGTDGLIPLLRALETRSESAWLRESARHVLRAMAKTSLSHIVLPVLRALQDTEPVLEAPIAAHEALDALMQVHRN
jgi:HEAT repeat protein